jgi:NADH:ubiquinone oxidoreductase subunit
MTPPGTMQISEIDKGFGRGLVARGRPCIVPATLPGQGKGGVAQRTSGQRGIRPMKTFFLRFFTWWNGQTLGTQVWTRLYGELVGEDEFGNRYYRTRGGKIDPTLGFERRWVIFNGYAEASMIPPGWHGWMHHTVNIPPTEARDTEYSWQKPHRPNLTGTPWAYRPPGSTLGANRRPPATGDYQAWKPGP